jgi:hypothetical protein
LPLISDGTEILYIDSLGSTFGEVKPLRRGLTFSLPTSSCSQNFIRAEEGGSGFQISLGKVSETLPQKQIKIKIKGLGT